MNPELLIPAIAVLAIITVVMVAVTNAVRMLIRHRERLAEASSRPALGEGQIEARLARLEQAVESIALEVERNGEAQRYLTKVLAKHLPPAPDAQQ